MHRRRFLTLAGAGIVAAGTSSILRLTGCAQQTGKTPNILWLDAEDLSPDLACYGHPLVHTPNLDRLAAEGARFTNAFVTCPVCSPSRASFATGMYQTTLGAHHHRPLSHYKEGVSTSLPEPVRIFTQYLREAGYFTCNGQALEPETRGKTGYSFDMPFQEAFDGTDWSQREADQPFFAQIHFPETHRTFRHDPERPIDPADVDLPPYYPGHPVTRLDWALYLETVQMLDKKVGAVLQRLEEKGLAENTAVFFTGDHGRPMVRGKQWLYDSGIRIPLIVRWPGVVQPGTIREDLVSGIDLTPTWLEIAGIRQPDYIEGQSLLEQNFQSGEYIYAARDRCDEADFRIRCIRSHQYKYIRNFYPERPFTQFSAYKKREYPVLTLMQLLHERGELLPEQARLMKPNRPVEELYDIQNDPFEVQNLAADPAYADILQTLRNELDRWICETNDQGRIPEDPDDTALIDRLEWEEFQGEMEDRGLSADTPEERYLHWWEQRLKELKQTT